MRLQYLFDSRRRGAQALALAGARDERFAEELQAERTQEETMFVVIFTVHPGPDKKDRYLGWAKHLKPKLEAIDGFIANERFAHTRRQGWLLSLSTWRDEQSLVRWRTVGEHRAAQEQGRREIFDDYRLRVGEVTADTSPPHGEPVEAMRCDTTKIGVSPWASITEVTFADQNLSTGNVTELPQQLGLGETMPGLVTSEVFTSLHNPGKRLLLVDWQNADAMAAWHPTAAGADLRHRQVRVIREYGMYERTEAPHLHHDN
jgi:heme-degrading monooxygenase HmoA